MPSFPSATRWEGSVPSAAGRSPTSSSRTAGVVPTRASRKEAGMKAYWIAPGPSGTGVELRETATPEPKPGEILVRVRASSLNRGELLGGKAGAPAKPGGGECAGEVIKTGDGVTGVAIGDSLIGSWGG